MDENSRPLNVPRVVLGLAAAFVVVHLARILLLSSPADDRLLWTFGFTPARYGSLFAEIPGGAAALIWSPLTYAFLHSDVVHLTINLLWMLVFGSLLARRFDGWRFLLLTLAAALGGALADYLTAPLDRGVMVGASAMISGQMGASLRFLFSPGGALSTPRLRQPEHAPAMSLVGVLRDPRAATFAIVWLAINLAVGLESRLFPGISQEIAWQAHIGGFLTGLGLFGLLDPEPSQERPPDA